MQVLLSSHTGSVAASQQPGLPASSGWLHCGKYKGLALVAPSAAPGAKSGTTGVTSAGIWQRFSVQYLPSSQEVATDESQQPTLPVTAGSAVFQQVGQALSWILQTSVSQGVAVAQARFDAQQPGLAASSAYVQMPPRHLSLVHWFWSLQSELKAQVCTAPWSVPKGAAAAAALVFAAAPALAVSGCPFAHAPRSATTAHHTNKPLKRKFFMVLPGFEPVSASVACEFLQILWHVPVPAPRAAGSGATRDRAGALPPAVCDALGLPVVLKLSTKQVWIASARRSSRQQRRGRAERDLRIHRGRRLPCRLEAAGRQCSL